MTIAMDNIVIDKTGERQRYAEQIRARLVRHFDKDPRISFGDIEANENGKTSLALPTKSYRFFVMWNDTGIGIFTITGKSFEEMYVSYRSLHSSVNFPIMNSDEDTSFLTTGIKLNIMLLCIGQDIIAERQMQNGK